MSDKPHTHDNEESSVMSNPETRVRLIVVDGEVNAYVDRIDRIAKTNQTLNHDGEWEEVGMYEARPDLAFTISKDRAREVLMQLSEGAA